MSAKPQPDPFDPDDPPDTRAHSLWPDSLRGTSEFMPTQLDPGVEVRGAAGKRWRPLQAVQAVVARLSGRKLASADTGRALRDPHAGLSAGFAAEAVAAARALVRADPERAEAVLDDLGVLLQAQGGPAARLADEVDLAQRYLGIQQLRYGARLQAAVELDPLTAGARLPTLALAELAAHAAREAVEASDAGGEVTIRVRAGPDRAVVLLSHTLAEDEDDTRGDAAEEALEAVRERLRLLHGANGHCEAWRDGGARHVRLTVPKS